MFTDYMDEILTSSDRSLSILIGENGCGKSLTLHNMAKEGLQRYSSVIAIATSMYDKFPRRNVSKKFHYMGSRIGRNIPRDIVKIAIGNLYDEGNKGFSSIFKVLKYVGYAERIGVEISGINPDFECLLLENNEIDENIKEEILYLIKYLMNSFSMFNGYDGAITWIGINEVGMNSNGEISRLLHLEKTLKKLKILHKIDIHITKDEYDLSMNIRYASSGEQTLIATMVFIASFIDENTLILIDEPENSLHPKWQREYVQTIQDIFSYYQPSIAIATHSPILISGLHKEHNVKIFKSSHEGIERLPNVVMGAEDLYNKMFDVLTPRNRSLSDRCAILLNNFSDGKVSFAESDDELNSYIENSFERSQLEFLHGVKRLLKKLQRNTN